ncbi:Endo-1,4-beta-xylanase A [Lachnellula subtilissima]|uniref:endo-1,4-beta-xylanase n=1 Tax=Lachnellula subtilissima TaxID=602034 RepID=A0A8H8RVF4_9HELO|nr:Endo-1,4-beta-xylanase A [Lachnellula subtilissima]
MASSATETKEQRSLSHREEAPSASEELRPQRIESNFTRRQTYSTDYTTGGTVNYSQGALGQYSVAFSQANDFVVGKGWSPGDTRHSLPPNLRLDHQLLIEYYVVEDYYPSTPSGSAKGTTTVSGDGETCIYASHKTNQPSIQARRAFCISNLRTLHRSSGTVTTANHFNAWKGLGLGLGTRNLQVVAVEGYW